MYIHMYIRMYVQIYINTELENENRDYDFQYHNCMLASYNMSGMSEREATNF